MPLVSIIVPCYNEERTIRLLLEAIYAQDYPHAELEVVIADGFSTDATRERIANFQAQYSDLTVRVVDNPQRIIPAGLNNAIRAGLGELIIRLDGHSIPHPDYISRCVKALQEGHGDAVGGVWEIRPGGTDWQARGIAAAASHPLGVGDAQYRYTDRPQATETVPFGSFRRSLLDRIGLYDETLLTNEDYEFNTRVRQAGGVVWLDPAIRSVYLARSTFAALARQYWRYGYWKARMLKRYPSTLRWRQGLPPLFVASLLSLGLLSPWLSQAWGLLLAEVFLYLVVLMAASVQMAFKKRDASLLPGLPLAIAVMHLTWGSAFIWSLIRLPFSQNVEKV